MSPRRPETDYTALTLTGVAARASQLTRVVLTQARPATVGRILDLGCGTGAQALDLATALPRAQVLGLDLSPANVAAAEAARAGHPAAARVAFRAGDYLTLREAPFDLIVSDGVLHLIPAPTETLFGRLAEDLRPGGLLVYTMPVEDRWNRVVVAVRRAFRACRSRATDALVLAVARALHGRTWSDALLRERVPYMYVIPERFDSAALHALLAERFRLARVATEMQPVGSIAKLRHRIVVLRREG